MISHMKTKTTIIMSALAILLVGCATKQQSERVSVFTRPEVEANTVPTTETTQPVISHGDWKQP